MERIISRNTRDYKLPDILLRPFSENSTESSDDSTISREPSLRFSQDTWWDVVLSLYNATSREQAGMAVNADLNTLFKFSSAWLSFVNVPLFFSQFHHPQSRAMMQPALVLGCLTYSAFIQGSEAEGGVLQRRKSSKLRELAQSAFDASYNAGWIDIGLAQAAWVCVLLSSYMCLKC